MSQQKKESLFITMMLPTAAVYATRFMTDFVSNLDPDLPGMDKAMKIRMLTRFRSVVLNNFEEFFVDENVDESFLHDPDKELVYLYVIYREFKEFYPDVEVSLMIPMDMAGTFGFVAEVITMKSCTTLDDIRSQQ